MKLDIEEIAKIICNFTYATSNSVDEWEESSELDKNTYRSAAEIIKQNNLK